MRWNFGHTPSQDELRISLLSTSLQINTLVFSSNIYLIILRTIQLVTEIRETFLSALIFYTLYILEFQPSRYFNVSLPHERSHKLPRWSSPQLPWDDLSSFHTWEHVEGFGFLCHCSFPQLLCANPESICGFPRYCKHPDLKKRIDNCSGLLKPNTLTSSALLQQVLLPSSCLQVSS